MTVTVAELRSQPSRVCAFLNYGQEGQGQIIEFRDYPRLTYLWRSHRGSAFERGRAAQSVTWFCDGIERIDFDAAVEAMARPPVITHTEAAVLELVPRTWSHENVVASVITGMNPTQRPRIGGSENPWRFYDATMERLARAGLIEYRSEATPDSSIAPSEAEPMPEARYVSLMRRTPDAPFSLFEA